MEFNKEVQKDLSFLQIPMKSWVDPIHEKVLDVAIIGGGMAGLSTSLALMKQGITHFRIFDENEQGKEGPWATYARMKTLRSPKSDIGPALEFPKLTFMAWFEAKYGKEKLDAFELAPTSIWKEYLDWFKEVLKLPVKNNKKLQLIEPKNDLLHLHFNDEIVQTRKVILATGRSGSGGSEIPTFMKPISKKYYYHTNEIFDHNLFKGKKVIVIGAGASAFDVSAVALEHHAVDVTMLSRRVALPGMNSFSELAFKGLLHGFYHLDDELKRQYFETYFMGVPPPEDSVDRIKNFENFQIHYNCKVMEVKEEAHHVTVHTNLGRFNADLIILGTGFSVDLNLRPEFSKIKDSIRLWNKNPVEKFPYVGPHFEFLGEAPFLKNIYCFNYGAAASHGLICNDIPGVSIGACRVSEGVAIDFFLSGSKNFLKKAL